MTDGGTWSTAKVDSNDIITSNDIKVGWIYSKLVSAGIIKDSFENPWQRMSC